MALRVGWKRQVSPAPATATFADVPVGNPLHRFVEALTDGCGGGKLLSERVTHPRARASVLGSRAEVSVMRLAQRRFGVDLVGVCRVFAFVFVMAAVGFTPQLAHAQLAPTSPAPAAPPEQAFGLGDQVTIITALQFSPYTGFAGQLHHVGRLPYAGGDAGIVYAADVTLPTGARFMSVACDVYDGDPGNAQIAVKRYTHNTATKTNVVALMGADASTSDVGYQTVSFLINDIYNPIRYEVINEMHIYRLEVTLTVAQLRGCRLYWQRLVSPAPNFATFADVPVGNPLHRFVEALVAAGITGGCGGANFCPNAAITRGQMAVFLAAALGLHWPF